MSLVHLDFHCALAGPGIGDRSGHFAQEPSGDGHLPQAYDHVWCNCIMARSSHLSIAIRPGEGKPTVDGDGAELENVVVLLIKLLHPADPRSTFK